MIIHDFSDLPDALRTFAVDQFIWQGFLELDPVTDLLGEATDVDTLRKTALASDRYAYWSWWLRFGAGFENLIKATFLRHQLSLLSKRALLEKSTSGSSPLGTPAAARVYEHVRSTHLTSTANAWLAAEFNRLNIQHPLELNSGTLGGYKRNLSLLTLVSVLSLAEEVLVSDAATVLADMRRNVDAHIFLKAQVGGSINGDLRDVYIPACNILLRASRKAV